MPTTPSEILELAERLHGVEDSEVARRSVVSRAYYAALHATKDTFPMRERLDGESSHAEIIGRAKAYGNTLAPGRTEANQIALWLHRMRILRNVADYELSREVTTSDAAGLVERARLVLSNCDDILRKRNEAQDRSAEA